MGIRVGSMIPPPGSSPETATLGETAGLLRKAALSAEMAAGGRAEGSLSNNNLLSSAVVVVVGSLVVVRVGDGTRHAMAARRSARRAR